MKVSTRPPIELLAEMLAVFDDPEASVQEWVHRHRDEIREAMEFQAMLEGEE